MNHTTTQKDTSGFGRGNSGLQIGENGGNITANFNYQSDEIEISQNRECLQALCETNPQRDKDRIERHKGGLLKGAYIWVLENEEFKRWRFEEKDQFLWIKGDPGKGKTMLLCGILNELIKSTVPSESNIIYFFCQATDAKLNNATGVLRGLVFMLVDQHPSLMSYVRREYDKDKRVFEDQRNSWETLSRILVKILEDPMLQKVYVIIDALDECTTDLCLLLEFIVKVQSSNMYAKWLVTSRNEASIEEILETDEIESKKENLSLELNEDSVSKAVESFINFRVEILSKRKKYSPGTRDAVTQHLLSNAHGTFLWVALVCEELFNLRLSNLQVLNKLKEFPAGLDTLYQRMLDGIDDSPDYKICRYILGITTIVYRPITLEELSSYIAFSEHDNISYVSQLIGLCGSFLTFKGSTISLVHQSAQEFFYQRAVDRIFPSGPGKLHYEIFSKSLDAINKTLRRDIYNLIHPGYEISKIEKPNPDPLAAVRYPCIYWVDHLQASSRQSRAELQGDFVEGGVIDAFFCQNYLFWLETMSLLTSVSKGITSIRKLEDLIESETHNTDLIDRVKDASRFLLYHQVAIRRWPLQVYASALIFSPMNSKTRIQYEDREPSWVIQKPDMEYQWSPCLQTLEGHSDSITSVLFSHDSKFLASASYDRTVKIWDTSSGECLTTFEHSGPVHNMAFSRNSKLLVSVSSSAYPIYSSESRSTIKLWDMDNSHCIMTIKDDDDLLTCVAVYEPDYIVCGSYNGTIRIWDIKSRKSPRVIEGHSSMISTITMSQNLGFLASASDDKTLKIWDIRSGKCVRTLGKFSHPIQSVAFSPDSLLLASGSASGSIELWNTQNWDCIHTSRRFGAADWSFEGPLVFSHDFRAHATGPQAHGIYLWDTSSFLLLQIFQGHGGSISSIAFSHDSKILASASKDYTIRIWNTTNRGLPREFGSHESEAKLYFSHDYKLLATTTVGRPYSVKIWDAHNGRCLETIDNFDGSPIDSLRFSHDLKYLASFLRNEMSQVRKIGSGEGLPLSNYYPLEKLSKFIDREYFDDNFVSPQFPQAPKFCEQNGSSSEPSEDLGMEEDGSCITWGKECLLWLPPEYRPARFGVFADDYIAGSRVYISCRSGRVLFFDFDSNAISQLITTSKAKELACLTSQIDAALG